MRLIATQASFKALVRIATLVMAISFSYQSLASEHVAGETVSSETVSNDPLYQEAVSTEAVSKEADSNKASTPESTATPAGMWVTIDDETGKPASEVMIWEDLGIWHGRVERILDDNDRLSRCKKCAGNKKDQPIEGMEILWGMKKARERYDHGKILDPTTGKIYSANMKLADHGEKLEVRGFIGISAIGRSQIWERAHPTQSASSH